MMEEIGLVASDTGAPGGKKTGDSVSHYIVTDGPFDQACDDFLSPKHFKLLYDILGEQSGTKAAASKTKYTCPGCDLNAWAKPNVSLICGECDEPLMEDLK